MWLYIQVFPTAVDVLEAIQLSLYNVMQPHNLSVNQQLMSVQPINKITTKSVKRTNCDQIVIKVPK